MLNGNFNTNVQNHNVMYTEYTCVYDFADLQQIFNQDSYPAGGSSAIQGEIFCTQGSTQHNSGGGSVYNGHNIFVKHQPMYQQSQMLCQSNCFTIAAVDHYLDINTHNCHNATLKYSIWHYFRNLTIMFILSF